MESAWIVQLIREAVMTHGKLEVISSDQGSRFTGEVYIKPLKDPGHTDQWTGKGRATDSIIIEGLWRCLKYEYEYLNPAADGLQLYKGLSECFRFYNSQRHHQKLENQKPADLYGCAA
jgi:putative transposase